ncbi:ribonuclease H-like YkuK family protein [Mesohalobacter halotolerans]|uniref:Uncharacterized protein n=1 Tax=Mesohalobacter halotolerans TaxID=1883405 RepID=A0A4U5TP88_9FLAO|nr:ribonuclease H-like YkuK family protein [Mesohalobacter halotolerans]MBS3739609.1 hypothetical protein [Psychroflexus sp.]TKS55662.1 hypothetical protein FCN74_10140 [Mesohalobacter halotolerans]
MQFKKLTDEISFDVAEYVKSYLNFHKNRNINLYLGCDSHNRLKTTYATTLVFNVGATGCHVIYQKEVVPLITDMWTRLWGEAERSVETALYLRERGIEIDTIDLDYNIDPAYKSNKLVSAAVGYVESLGFKARVKPELLPAVYAADHIVG